MQFLKGQDGRACQNSVKHAGVLEGQHFRRSSQNDGTVLDTLIDISQSSVGDARRDADAYAIKMQNAEFVVALCATHFILSFLADVTLALQSRTCDLTDAYRNIRLARSCIEDATLGCFLGKTVANNL